MIFNNLKNETVHSVFDYVVRENIPRKEIDVNFLKDFENVRPFVVFKLVNPTINEELLKTVPHVPYKNLTIIFQVLIDGFAPVTITHRDCKLWEIGIEELVFTSRRNTPKLLPCEIRNMGEFIVEVMKTRVPSDIKNICNIGMYVMTNTKKVNGAATILYRGVLQDFADAINDNLYILPSSVNEVVLLPAHSVGDREELSQMVKDVNDTEVEPDEVLSYSVYYYNRVKGELSVL